jgi:hypothetical protein
MIEIEFMGYTHYWWLEEEIPRETWVKIRRDAETLIAAFPEPLSSWTKADDECIQINGEDPDSFEGFGLTRIQEHPLFCKTFRVPADALVCAVLSIANEYHPALSVSSDAVMGDQPDTWPDACAWASEVLGREVKPPWSRPMRVHPVELAIGMTLGFASPEPTGLRRLWSKCRAALRKAHFGLLTLEVVARLLHCSKAHVSNVIAGRVPGCLPLPAVRLGRRKLVRRESLLSWIASNEAANDNLNQSPKRDRRSA